MPCHSTFTQEIMPETLRHGTWCQGSQQIYMHFSHLSAQGLEVCRKRKFG